MADPTGSGTAGDEFFDVVIVGGGPAGSCTAGQLAQRGHRVLVLERETFPRYHIGESLITGMLSVMEDLGLLERLEAYGFPKKNGLSLVWGAKRELWNVNFAELGGPYPYSYHVRRAEFDKLLLDRAVELGAEVRFQATVGLPVVEDDRVVGVSYTIGDSAPRVVRAALVVDASGQARALTRHLAAVSWQEDLRSLAYWTYFSPTGDLPAGQEGNILVEKVTDGWFWAIPVGTTPPTLSVGFVTPTETVKAADVNIAELYARGIAESRQLKHLLAGAEQVDQFRTTRDWSYLTDRFSGPGWLAVGDAGAFIDPLFSGGVCLSILASHPAARAADVAVRRPDLAERALEGYHAGYHEMISGFLEYVRFFYNPDRDVEDYFQQAEAMMAFNEQLGSAREAFIAVISGTAAMSTYFDIPDTTPVAATAEGERG
ncbi:NAD(P)/FAD-dependent oxidoreductase [Micromonospora sp. WMMD964]|uniref:NAD(P)/FAD-dependent oxidoreductase n=1 Tax=Micromonospora sp. WMMD964 TaxID=3016091 RepID=UPI002499FEAD|nr:NAD(P)/FAD-dependent oxidoreductase [Micromonospora sp. WMMD964]WFE98668.1 NAD(P)/FAD-dependent oxidoreductase [Micromonospora sp. WMMD964]